MSLAVVAAIGTIVSAVASVAAPLLSGGGAPEPPAAVAPPEPPKVEQADIKEPEGVLDAEVMRQRQLKRMRAETETQLFSLSSSPTETTQQKSLWENI